MKAAFDKFLEKIISRKLLTFIIATCLLIWSDLSGDIWGQVALIYIGTQGAIDAVKAWKGYD